MVNLNSWAKQLKIDLSSLKQSYKRLDGTRLLIQAENEDYCVTLSKTYKPKIETVGVSNRCYDGSYVLFADYDQIYKDLVYKNLNNLMRKYPLKFDNFFIATTEPETILKRGKIKGSYHAVCFTKFKKDEIKLFLEDMDVDPHFASIPFKTAHKCHVLRLDKKYWQHDGTEQKEEPKFCEIYPREIMFSTKENSHAHYKLFSRFWNFYDPYFAFRKWDFPSKMIELHEYSTPKGA